MALPNFYQWKSSGVTGTVQNWPGSSMTTILRARRHVHGNLKNFSNSWLFSNFESSCNELFQSSTAHVILSQVMGRNLRWHESIRPVSGIIHLDGRVIRSGMKRHFFRSAISFANRETTTELPGVFGACLPVQNPYHYV